MSEALTPATKAGVNRIWSTSVGDCGLAGSIGTGCESADGHGQKSLSRSHDLHIKRSGEC
ncbi:hypothetical protein KCP77_05215 [Salmonella enterica subsp. enterica]|nr:hypothetical protein KCP77_05215 [Salmonella enterica subsp. enterica]